MRPQVALGALFGVAGTALVFAHELAGFDLESRRFTGIVLSLLAVSLASLGNMMSVRNQAAGLPVVQTNAYSMLYAGILVFIVALLRGLPIVFDPSLAYVGSFLFLAIFATAIGFGGYLTLLGQLGADRAAYIMVLFPIVALAMSTAFEGFHWTAEAAAGVALVLFGNLLVLLRLPGAAGASQGGGQGMTPEHFQTLARYNQWANRRLYDFCAALDETEYKRKRPAFFGSIHGTLNHLLVGDRAWLARIEHVELGVTALDQILYDEFAELRAAREAEDRRIVALADRLDAAALATTLDYATMAGVPQRTRLDWVLTHVFNHQTHHRGQVHGLLSQTPIAPPPLDLIFYLREVSRTALTPLPPGEGGTRRFSDGRVRGHPRDDQDSPA